MAKSIYLDKVMRPDEITLTVDLGRHWPLWEEVLRYTEETYAAFTSEWKYYGKAWGWCFVLKSKAKTLCYLVPAEGCFQVAVIFNDRGRALATEAGLPEDVAQAVEASKDNPKNIPYNFKVTQAADVEVAKKLIAVRAKT